MEKLKMLIVSGSTVRLFYSCSMHDNRYHCYHNLSNISLSESAEALTSFSP